MHIRKIGIIGRTYRHVQRYRQILAVLFRYGFGDLVDTLKIEQYIEVGLQMISRKRREKIESLTRAERVRMALEELGPTFVKMGQFLSTRPDLLPVEFIKELEKLQDHVPPVEFPEVEKIIETELGAPLRDTFMGFSETPLASASIGQVHRATLMDGDEVIVKVQRPHVRKTIEVDLEIMLHIATLTERHLKAAEVHRPTRLVEEFARTIEKELDYTFEAAHVERFAMQFMGDRTIYVPKIYRETTTRCVLTMEYVRGVKASDIEKLQQEGLDTREIARRGFDLILKQIFVHGFFHADPHPGNIFVLPNNVICYLDFGMMGRISRKSRENFADLVMSIVRRDEVKATDAFLRLTTRTDEPDRDRLERDVADFIDRHFYRPLKDLDLMKILHQLMEIASRYKLIIPPDLFLMIKALGNAEGLGRKLDPNFDATSQAAPVIKSVQMQRLHPRRIGTDLVDSGIDFLHLLMEIPGEVRDILRQARLGRVKLEFEHRGLEPMLSTHDRISNRLAFAIVLAALIIGSSLIVLSGIPPKWHEIPLIGLAGFLIAGIMGFWLLVTILRRGRM
ncbi:MAG: AarF/ABC1/UbiB kinase family protein [Deltaproteobacteria bacterium]|nr:AarF/ABC1/UbiB kinase family protein [Deltaproteobacteria bacterium]MBW2138577.1 AarF/ABC1/UbiB kinase family protein [Deltaproteobacteria bacterium]